MTLAAGTRLGPYEITTLLGAGGMGEVYKTRDTRLERTVAIKVLLAHTAQRPEVRQRFEREARAVSALNHPHICTLHDVGREGGLDYLVMEFVQGESLADRLKRGALPLELTLRIAMEVADALDRAHQTGIIHRDLKPGNIMLTKDGAKVLDFGLAKFGREGTRVALDGGGETETLTTPLTSEGVIIGTLQYMAPEQLQGQEADGRSDVFAFGTVLYQMLTGRRAFEAPTKAGLIVQIMEHQPAPVSAILPAVPPVLEQLVRTCLAKDPADRRQTMRDVLLDLKWIASGGSPADPAVQPVQARRSRAWKWTAGTLVFVAATTVLALAWRIRARPDEPVMRLTLAAPDRGTFGFGLALSPDGKRLEFVARQAGGQDLLWVRALDSLAAQPLAGSEGATFPFWSPDSQFVAFFAQGKLKKTDFAGGAIQIICDANEPRGGSWGRDGTILFSPDPIVPVHRVPAAGGTPVPVTKLNASRSELGHRWPLFLPDGRWFIYYSMCKKPADNALVLASVDGKESRILMPSDSAAAYSPAGYLLFSRGSNLMAQRFSVSGARLDGDPFPVAQDIAVTESNAGPAFSAHFSVSATGTLVYRRGGARSEQLAWFDRMGKPLGNVGPPGTTGDPDLSPDGKRVVVDGPGDLWVLDTTHGGSSRFTFSGAGDLCGVWSPDGRQIVFGGLRNQQQNLYVKSAIGGGDEQVLLSSDVGQVPDDWSRDGRRIVFESFSPKTKFDLWWLPLDGDRKPVLYRQTEFNEAHARLSPDGRWLAYTSDETGRYEVYVQSFPGTEGGKFLVSANGGDQPSWRADGKELFFLALDRKLMAVNVKIGGAFEASAPKALFQTDVPTSGVAYIRNHYVPSRDGQKFLVVNVPVEQAAAPLVVVLNWAPRR